MLHIKASLTVGVLVHPKGAGSCLEQGSVQAVASTPEWEYNFFLDLVLCMAGMLNKKTGK